MLCIFSVILLFVFELSAVKTSGGVKIIDNGTPIMQGYNNLRYIIVEYKLRFLCHSYCFVYLLKSNMANVFSIVNVSIS